MPQNTIKQLNWQNLIILVLIALLIMVCSAYVTLSAKKPATHQQVNLTASNADFEANVERFEWKLVTSWPKGFPGLGTAPETFADIVTRMSRGRLSIKVFGARELVPPLGVFDAVSQGSVEVGHTAAYYWKGKSPAAPFFTTIPFGMTAQETNAWLHYGGGLELWREIYAPFNLYPLAGGNTGVQMAGWFNKEINSIADIKGLKMRIPGIAGEVFTRVGGTAVNIAGGDLYTSLKTGVIDATEWVGPYNDLSMGFHEVAKYYYYPGWHEPGPTLEIIVNKPAFDTLPDDLKVIVEIAAKAANQDMLDEYTARNNAALEELINEHGVKLRQLPNDVLKSLKKVSDDVIAEMVSADPLAKKIHDSYSAFANSARNYHRISEKAYINARDQLD